MSKEQQDQMSSATSLKLMTGQAQYGVVVFHLFNRPLDVNPHRCNATLVWSRSLSKNFLSCKNAGMFIFALRAAMSKPLFAKVMSPSSSRIKILSSVGGCEEKLLDSDLEITEQKNGCENMVNPCICYVWTQM